MPFIFKRLGSAISPAWSIPLLIIGLSIGAAYWVGPLRPLPPELRLLALQRDGTFTDSIEPAPRRFGDDIRFPLVLGAQNIGYADARPAVLDLSVPLGFHLVDRDGRALPQEISMGTPLGRYRLGLSASKLVPGGVPELLLDTLWLEADLSSYTCAVLNDGVPEFQPRPPVNPALLGKVDIFYSFLTPDSDIRQAGLLRVRVDSTLLRVPTAVMGEFGPPILEEPAVELPPLDALYQIAKTDATCGDPQQPVQLQSVIYENEGGGRFLVVYHEGAPRKYLLDLNADSIVEREVWDPDGDGNFEATRTTRYAIPGFLFPRRVEIPALAADTVPPDPAFLALYADTARGPFRFYAAEQQRIAAAQAPPAGMPGVASGATSRASGPAATAGAATPGVAIPAGAPIAADTTPPDPAFLVLYSDTAAGPFRFARREQQVRDSIADAIARGDTATEPPPPRRRTGPRILGTPVEYPPGTRPPD